MTPARRRSFPPGAWVPSAYIAEGIPFAMVIWVAGTMFKDLGRSDGEITLATASIGIVWSLKPLWAAYLDRRWTKRTWVLLTEMALAVLLALSGVALGTAQYFHVVLALLWVLAFASATQDICVDGVYITELDDRRQAAWIGVQGMCWNVGRIVATAGVVWVAGALEKSGRAPRAAWAIALAVSAAAMGLLAIFHTVTLPTGSIPDRSKPGADPFAVIIDAVREFLRKPSIWGMLAFVFLYRAGKGSCSSKDPSSCKARSPREASASLWPKRHSSTGR